MFWFSKWEEEGRQSKENDDTRRMMKMTKKVFIKRLRVISRQYKNNMIAEAASKAEINRDDFWKIMKCLKGTSSKVVRATLTVAPADVYYMLCLVAYTNVRVLSI